MSPRHVLVVAVAALSVAACADSRGSADGTGGAAVAQCRSVLDHVGSPERLATTV